MPSAAASPPTPSACCTACSRPDGLSAVEVLATMNRTYGQLLALDGAAVSGEQEAAALLGSAPFVAKKALEQCRRLGSARIAQAIVLLAEADLDVKGATGLPAELVPRDPGGAAEPANQADAAADADPADPAARSERRTRREQAVFETPDELRQLQAAARYQPRHTLAPTCASIISDERRVDAAELCRRLEGMRLLVVATVTDDGRPLVGPVDGYLLGGSFYFSSGRDSVRMRHLAARPACQCHPPPRRGVRGDRARPRRDLRDSTIPAHAVLRKAMLDYYLPRQGPGFETWLDNADALGARIVADRMFTFQLTE